MGTKTPNFIIGGTAAGGTSFLAAILVQHPRIYLPKEMRPEPHYFYKSWEYEKGIDYYLSRWFAGVPETAQAIGERSSSYLFGGESVAKKIASEYPHMKFIFTLRNPIERTWANYRYTVLQGLEDLSFGEALSNERDRVGGQRGIWAEIQPHNYTGRGFYGAQIKGFLEHFDSNNMLLIKSELLSSQTDIELKRIIEFLGIKSSKFTYRRPVNHTSVSVRNPKLQMEMRDYFGGRFDKVIEAIRREENLKRHISNAQDKDKIRQLSNNLTGEKKHMAKAEREYLTGLFSEDFQLIQEHVSFNISDWQ